MDLTRWEPPPIHPCCSPWIFGFFFVTRCIYTHTFNQFAQMSHFEAPGCYMHGILYLILIGLSIALDIAKLSPSSSSIRAVLNWKINFKIIQLFPLSNSQVLILFFYITRYLEGQGSVLRHGLSQRLMVKIKKLKLK